MGKFERSDKVAGAPHWPCSPVSQECLIGKLERKRVSIQ